MTASYGRLVALSRVTLRLPVGSMTAVLGPPEAGKTTLLRCLLGSLVPRSGDVQVLGHAPSVVRGQLGFVPDGQQADWAFPVTTLDVVLMGRGTRPGLFRPTSRPDIQRAQAVLEQVGLIEQARWRVGRLDLDQRRRLLLARALVKDSVFLLFDEPFAGLWPAAVERLSGLLSDLRATGRTVLATTREVAAVSGAFPRIVLLNGRVLADGEPQSVLTARALRETFGARPMTITLPVEAFAVDGPSQR